MTDHKPTAKAKPERIEKEVAAPPTPQSRGEGRLQQIADWAEEQRLRVPRKPTGTNDEHYEAGLEQGWHDACKEVLRIAVGLSEGAVGVGKSADTPVPKDRPLAEPDPAKQQPERCPTCGSDDPRFQGKPGTPRYQLHPGDFPSGDSRCLDPFHTDSEQEQKDDADALASRSRVEQLERALAQAVEVLGFIGDDDEPPHSNDVMAHRARGIVDDLRWVLANPTPARQAPPNPDPVATPRSQERGLREALEELVVAEVRPLITNNRPAQIERYHAALDRARELLSDQPDSEEGMECSCQPDPDCLEHGTLWDCGDCGTTDIHPSMRFCPNCTATTPPETGQEGEQDG